MTKCHIICFAEVWHSSSPGLLLSFPVDLLNYNTGVKVHNLMSSLFKLVNCLFNLVKCYYFKSVYLQQ